LSLPIAINSTEQATSMTFGEEIVEQVEDKPNPFDVLASLKKNLQD
jgi:uncharacterized metal-binding protein YceD (DUF177 family)